MDVRASRISRNQSAADNRMPDIGRGLVPGEVLIEAKAAGLCHSRSVRHGRWRADACARSFPDTKARGEIVIPMRSPA